jgi:hypothetical protein
MALNRSFGVTKTSRLKQLLAILSTIGALLLDVQAATGHRYNPREWTS